MSKLKYHNNKSKEDPLVSVIIPAYNAATYIQQTLESVCRQTYKSLEIIVVDDGSTDSTSDIVSTYRSRDNRLLLIKQQNLGVAAARNAAIRASSGAFVAPLDADDIWFPDHLEKQVRCLTVAPDHVALAYSWSVDIDLDGKETGDFRASEIEGKVLATLISHNFIGNASATIIRRCCFEKVGLYDISLRKSQAQGCEDWDLYLRIAEEFEFASVSAFTVGYRKFNQSMSRNYEQMSHSHSLVMKAVQQRHPEINDWLFRLSACNLYFYFARQCEVHNFTATSLFWIRKAIRRDPITCWLHPDLYIILYWAGLSKVKPQLRRDREVTRPTGESVRITQRSTKAKLTIAAGNIYHWSISNLNQLLSSGKEQSQARLKVKSRLPLKPFG
jgi:glycosyltransferase involved in cell wall biosynthesis